MQPFTYSHDIVPEIRWPDLIHIASCGITPSAGKNTATACAISILKQNKSVFSTDGHSEKKTSIFAVFLQLCSADTYSSP